MAAAAAEQNEVLAPEQPGAFLVNELPQDEFIRSKANRFIRDVGALALHETIAYEAMESVPNDSLMTAIHKAAAGDETALKSVETNVRTDAVERAIKAGHITKVPLEIDEQGKIKQFGQAMESIQANTLRFASANPKLRARSEYEARNAFRIEYLNREKLLDDYNFVVFSRAADDMSLEEAREAGFFTDTMSCAIQVTSTSESELTTESAFVAGIARSGEARHDAETIISLAAEWGVDYSDMSAAELLDAPLLVHKSLMPNGVIDMVALYDKHAGGTFFGEAKSQQDYLAYKEACAVREKSFAPKVAQVVQDLLQESATIANPVMAVQRLHKLSEARMVEQATADTTINPRVFGQVAANHIEMARWHVERGNYELVLQEVSEAKRTAKSSSCPSGAGGGAGSQSFGEGATISESKRSGADEDCEFLSKECPLCKAKNVKTKISKIGGKTIIEGKCGCRKVA